MSRSKASSNANKPTDSEARFLRPTETLRSTPASSNRFIACLAASGLTPVLSWTVRRLTTGWAGRTSISFFAPDCGRGSPGASQPLLFQGGDPLCELARSIGRSLDGFSERQIPGVLVAEAVVGEAVNVAIRPACKHERNGRHVIGRKPPTSEDDMDQRTTYTPVRLLNSRVASSTTRL